MWIETPYKSIIIATGISVDIAYNYDLVYDSHGINKQTMPTAS